MIAAQYAASVALLGLLLALGMAVAHPLTTIRLIDRAIAWSRHQLQQGADFRRWEIECDGIDARVTEQSQTDSEDSAT